MRCNNVIYAHSFTIAAAERERPSFVYMQLSRNEFLETNTAPAPRHCWKIIIVIILWYLFIYPHADEPRRVYAESGRWMIIVP